MKTVHKKEDNLFPAGNQQLNKLIARFHGIKHRCGRDRHYLRVTFKFESAREAAEYMLAVCGPLPEPAEGPNLSIDRIDGRRGYERGNLRYATMQEQLANRRFKTREHPLTGQVTCP